MAHSVREIFLVLACDMPCVTSAILARLIEEYEGGDIVVPVTSDGRPQPLCALYHRSCLPEFHERLLSSHNKLVDIFRFPALKVKYLHSSSGCFLDSDLANINSKSDLSVLLNASFRSF
jgi:molybdopterin-guanine dinucleotide biosynthesis protein A